MAAADDLLGDRAETDGDARFLDLGLEDRGGRRIELTGQEAVEELDDEDFGAPAADGPGDLQAEQAPAEDGGPLVVTKMAEDGLRVVERPQDEDALLSASGDGSDGRPGACRQEEDVVGE